ncbi:MAG TPA: SagB/ThcOx family dehydrogenase [Anaerolineae bacterium]
MTSSIGQTFMVQSQHRFRQPTGEERGLPQPPLQLPYDATAPALALPKPETLQVPPADLRETIEARRTVRAYADRALSLDELSWLLWCTQGVERLISRPATVRPVPSAGARHAFETYLLVNRVDGAAAGLYRFAAIEHKLLVLNHEPDLVARMVKVMDDQEMVRDCAVTFIWVAVLERMYWRYGERGYRYLFLDAGHVCQNLYLAAAPLDCGACAIGDFFDDDLNALLGLDGISQFTVYAATLGKRKHL